MGSKHSKQQDETPTFDLEYKLKSLAQLFRRKRNVEKIEGASPFGLMHENFKSTSQDVTQFLMRALRQ